MGSEHFSEGVPVQNCVIGGISPVDQKDYLFAMADSLLDTARGILPMKSNNNYKKW